MTEPTAVGETRTHGRGSTMPKVIAGVIVVFLGFWMFTDPSSLAATGESLAATTWSAVSAVFTAVIDFVREL